MPAAKPAPQKHCPRRNSWLNRVRLRNEWMRHLEIAPHRPLATNLAENGCRNTPFRGGLLLESVGSEAESRQRRNGCNGRPGRPAKKVHERWALVFPDLNPTDLKLFFPFCLVPMTGCFMSRQLPVQWPVCAFCLVANARNPRWKRTGLNGRDRPTGLYSRDCRQTPRPVMRWRSR